ncbi:hypothetical protein AB0T83_18815 [Fluviibacterium sp. DFM31]|uniref:HTH cro/C1-type domain-containing protein n=1 Tax=Meridianimarinicoccus marinus TaxID=3231483 RepID=A0ABV3LCT1_9RHOB
MFESTWKARLEAAIKASGKSARAVSLASGSSPGYVSGILTEGKEPSIGKFLAICTAIPASPLHVLFGISAEPEDETILRALQESPEVRAAILALISKKRA